MSKPDPILPLLADAAKKQEAATAGEWTHTDYPSVECGHQTILMGDAACTSGTPADAAFIAAARNLPLGQLLARLEAAEAVVEAAKRYAEAHNEIEASIELRSPPDDHWYDERETSRSELTAALAALAPAAAKGAM